MLQELKFRPGINREATSLANEGGWFDSDKVRFRSGYPQKLGGWVRDTGQATAALQPPAGAYWGVARATWNWRSLSGSNLLSLGTNLKYYIQNSTGGGVHDVTPIRYTSSATATFAATPGSDVIVVTDPGHAAQEGDFLTVSGAAALGGNITAPLLNAEHRVSSYINGNTYTFSAAAVATAGDVGNGGAAVVVAYQLSTGGETYNLGTGWGAGGFGGVTEPTHTGWGEGVPAAQGIGIQLRTWSHANYGQDLIINPRGGGLYYWANNANPSIFDRAQRLASTSAGIYQTDTACPSACNFLMVSDASRFVLAFGANPVGQTVVDPLLVRWSDQENYALWAPAITNQAGDYRLSQGSGIITAQQTRQEVLIWTDTALYAMQYQGPPYVWGFQPMASNITIAGPNAAVTVNDATYWMGSQSFYAYNGRVQPLPCAVHQYVFGDLNISQSYQIAAASNAAFHEVWWFYCSANSTRVDRYVTYNYLENIWYYGTMARTTWLDAGQRVTPIATGYDGSIVYHEVGTDDVELSAPRAIEAYIQSADADLDAGGQFGFVHRLIPDLTFDGSTTPQPKVTFGLRPRQFPGSNYVGDDSKDVHSKNSFLNVRNYKVQQFTPQVFVRVRGRQIALRISSEDLGVAWRVGVPRVDVRPDGQR
jgi:hypothetical protein